MMRRAWTSNRAAPPFAGGCKDVQVAPAKGEPISDMTKEQSQPQPLPHQVPQGGCRPRLRACERHLDAGGTRTGWDLAISSPKRRSHRRRPQSSSTLPRYVGSFASKAWQNHSIGALCATCQWPRRWLRMADDFLASNACSLMGLRRAVAFNDFFLHVTTCASK